MTSLFYVLHDVPKSDEYLFRRGEMIEAKRIDVFEIEHAEFGIINVMVQDVIALIEWDSYGKFFWTGHIKKPDGLELLDIQTHQKLTTLPCDSFIELSQRVLRYSFPKKKGNRKRRDVGFFQNYIILPLYQMGMIYTTYHSIFPSITTRLTDIEWIQDFHSTPIMVRVVNHEGIVLRDSSHIQSKIVGHAPFGSILLCDAKRFVDQLHQPSETRFRLLQHHVWFSMHAFQNVLNIELIGFPTLVFQEKWLDEFRITPYVPFQLHPSTMSQCLFCHNEPRHYSFVHNDTCHTVCCSTCLHKYQNNFSTFPLPCPICRQPAHTILRNFF